MCKLTATSNSCWRSVVQKPDNQLSYPRGRDLSVVSTIWHPLSNFWGARDGTVVRALASRQCGPGSNPGINVICGLSLLLVRFFAPGGFSLGTPVFPSPQKPTFPSSNSIRNQVDEEPLSGCATSKSLFYYFIYL